MKKLRPYQLDAIKYMQRHDHYALFMEMRLGKTLTCIRRIKQLGVKQLILIVAPNSALSGWQDELETENQGTVVRLLGSRGKKIELLSDIQSDSNIWVLTNKESHLSIGDYLVAIKWDVVVLDESTFIMAPFKKKIVKDDAGKITKSFYTPKISHFYVNNFRDVSHRIVLTGTPAPNNELNYYNQLQFVDPTILNCKSYWDFRRNNFRLYGFNWVMMKNAREQLGKKLTERCFFLTRRDVNLGGEKIYEKRMAKLEDSPQRMYNRILKEFILEQDNEIISTIYATEKFIWLRRICGGSLNGKIVSSAKLNSLTELINTELAREQIIIWCQFIDELKMLKNIIGMEAVMVYGEQKIGQREDAIKQFMTGKKRIFIAQPECFKMGVDLSCSRTMIYYSTPFGLTRYQTEDRFVNVSNTDSLLVIDMIIEDSIEEDILVANRQRENNQQLLERIRKGLKNET